MRRAISLAAAALLSAAALLPAEAPTENPTQQTKPAPRWKDVELKKAIEERFARSAIAVDKFKVDVHDGVAHITGKADVMQHKGVATRLAKSMGARAVKNDIEITDAARRRAAEQLLRGKAAPKAPG